MVNLSIVLIGVGLAQAAVSADPTKTSQKSEITGCHFHGDTQFCIDQDGAEGSIVPAPTSTSNAPEKYTGCHKHGKDTFCETPDGEEVQFKGEEEGGKSSDKKDEGGKKKNCHFHAGVEHCVDEGEEEEEEKEHSHGTSCERVDRDFNIPLRIGLLFVILVTSAIGVFGPMVAKSFLKIPTTGVVFTVIKQFGTGVIISTALVHLMTHANLMWGNDCLGELKYEATSSAITMAGMFLAFFLEYIGSRMFGSSPHHHNESGNNTGDEDVEKAHPTQDTANSSTQRVQSHDSNEPVECLIEPNSKVSVLVMEAGIVFHSILIGITLVVAGDSFFITLFIVIIFHQMFEGLSLGARISTLRNTNALNKIVMGLIFSLITPIGMAIGIGVLSKFNGNDPSTLIALGTLDAFSAGVLLWTGLVEMWAHDWIFGYLASASWLITSIAMVSLMAGMVLMSLLGKWA